MGLAAARQWFRSIAPVSALRIGLIGSYDLAETSGARLDQSGEGYHLAQFNAVGSAAGVGAGQTAAVFDAAASQYLLALAASAPQPNGAPFEIALWVRPDVTAANLRTIASWAVGSSDQIVVQANQFALQAFMRNAANTATSSATLTGLAGGTWYLVTAGYDGDNVFITRNAAAPATTPIVGLRDVEMDFRLGGRGDTTNYALGRYQACRVYGRVLTADQRTQLYAAGAAALLHGDL